MKLNPVQEQVIVITGAFGGIGRETALQFAERDTKVVAAASSEPALQFLVQSIEQEGSQATYQVCDVTDFAQVRTVAAKAEGEYGRIDT